MFTVTYITEHLWDCFQCFKYVFFLLWDSKFYLETCVLCLRQFADSLIHVLHYKLSTFCFRAADLLLGGAVMNKPFQPHESHIPYALQVRDLCYSFVQCVMTQFSVKASAHFETLLLGLVMLRSLFVFCWFLVTCDAQFIDHSLFALIRESYLHSERLIVIK